MSHLSAETSSKEIVPKKNPLLEYPSHDATFQKVIHLVQSLSGNSCVIAKQYLHEDQILTKDDIDTLLVALSHQLGLKRTRCLRWHIKKVKAAVAEQRRVEEEADRLMKKISSNGKPPSIIPFFRPKQPWDIQISVLIVACQLASRSRTSQK